MTTIIIDGATQAVYTDGRTTGTNSIGVENYKTATPKAFSMPDGSVVVCSGSVALKDQIKRLSDKIGELVLTSYTKIEEDSTVFHVVWKEDGLWVNRYISNGKHVGSWLEKVLGVLFSDKHDGYSIDHFNIGTGNYLTAGSGGDYAFTALECDKSPEEAIKIASLCDRFTDDVRKYVVVKNIK